MLRRFALGLPLALCACVTGEDLPPATDLSVPAVRAIVETPPVVSSDDAADDPAIWVTGPDRGDVIVLGTDKQSGLYAYGRNGGEIGYLPAGNLNNVDVRDVSAGRALAVASNRSDDTVVVLSLMSEWVLSSPYGPLSEVGRFPAMRAEPYGICLGAVDGGYVTAVTHKTGEVDLYRIDLAAPTGSEWLATTELKEQLEGCVFDEDNGWLFVGREEGGISRFTLRPDGTLSDEVGLDRVGSETGIVADIEGLAIYDRGQGDGYLVASSQGNNTFAVYDRKSGAFYGRFRVETDPDSGIDGAEETDGIDVTSMPMPGYPEGLLVVQDGFNDPRGTHQNFKYVNWVDVSAALGLAD